MIEQMLAALHFEEQEEKAEEYREDKDEVSFWHGWPNITEFVHRAVILEEELEREERKRRIEANKELFDARSCRV